jgi:nucleotide-binding universal stress UspA family protein
MMKGEGHTKGRGTKARNPVKVIGFNVHGTLAEVHPSGHKGTEWIPIKDLLPWWTRNHDLREKYKITEEDEEDDVLGDVAFIMQKRRTSVNLGMGAESIRIEKEPVAVTQPEPEPPKQPVMKPFLSKPTEDAPHVAPMGIRRIVVDPNASDTWMEDLKDLKEAIGHKQAADQQVLIAQKEAEEAMEIVKSYATALAGKGVAIEWDVPDPVPEPGPVRRGPSRARTEADIPDADLAVVRHYRSHLLKQMVVGRVYNTEEIRVMLQAEGTPKFVRALNLAFRNHPRLQRLQGNRYRETSFSILS